MSALLDQYLLNPILQLAPGQILQWAMLQFYAFTLVLVRISGLMIIGPVFGQPIFPTNIRVLLIVCLSILITPTLHEQVTVGFYQLDANQDHRLSQDEVPAHLQKRFEELLVSSGRQGERELTVNDYRFVTHMPASLLDYAWSILGELTLGFALGLGVFLILLSLQMAGQMIDQQAGMALGEVFNPGFDMNASLSGQYLYYVGIAVFLLMEPINGHLLMLSALIDTFQVFPVGEGIVSTNTLDLLQSLMHQSLVLSIKVAAPLLAISALISLAMGYLGHTVPQINVLVIGFPIRAIVSLVVLIFTLSGAADIVVESIPSAIDQISRSTVM
ncbi:flagellar biosynthetic protein FliR [Gimesia chilikensis]|uniref:Flagellar biosynthetic protein FliR n=1 Tax=Gimesia chilikensis TaxID=2605989 RepID=A0A517WB97_9PLAN|nr:flagellar biosynthetic protein FliR [Gimesia chilikensis]QDU02525.1 Flagellar biosynthetic protein FliR [Gimesia chilikensis]